jgi:hypothetical protein
VQLESANPAAYNRNAASRKLRLNTFFTLQKERFAHLRIIINLGLGEERLNSECFDMRDILY